SRIGRGKRQSRAIISDCGANRAITGVVHFSGELSLGLRVQNFWLRILENRGFVQQLPRSESSRTKHCHVIDNSRLARRDQVRHDVPCRGSMHYAVSAEAVGSIEAR